MHILVKINFNKYLIIIIIKKKYLHINLKEKLVNMFLVCMDNNKFIEYFKV